MNNLGEDKEVLAAAETSVDAPGEIADLPPALRAVWNRVGLLLGALFLIKLAILWTFRKPLYEIHWRVGNEVYSWVNEVAFYLFALLVGLNLWKLSTRCTLGGARIVRFANGCVLFLAAFFIFLTFQEADKSYLYALTNGFLTWADLRWYIIMNFCFRSPFLAAWVIGYTAVYYGFRRTGREHLMLRITATCAAIYLALFLNDLKTHRDALLVIDCIGLTCLFPIRRAVALSLLWLGLLFAWGSALFFLFAAFVSRVSIAHLLPEFALIFWGTVILFTCVSLFAWRRGFFTAWSPFLPFAATAFLLLANINYEGGRNYENLICTGLMLPRYFLGEFMFALVLGVAAFGYLKWRPKASLWWVDAIALALITIALADLRLSEIMGARLDWDVLALAFGETPKMMWRMSRPYLPALAGGILLIGIIYALSLRATRRMGQKSGSLGTSVLWDAKFVVAGFVGLALLGEFLLEHDKAEGQTITRLAETSPLLRHAGMPVMNYETFVNTSRQLGVDTWNSPRPTSFAGARRDLNVVIVFQESTYNKYLSLFGSKYETEPLLSKYQDRMELFPNFYSDFAGSINARFATFTGLYPVRDFNAFTVQRVPVKSIFEVLNENGYSCSLFYSSFFDYTGFRDFLRGREIGEMYDADNMPGQQKSAPVSWGLQEEDTLGAMKERIRKYAADKQKFFLTYVPAAPHHPFDGTPQRFRKNKVEDMGDLTPVYINELLYMDWVIASLVDELKDAGLLDKTLIVITGDHGEMLGENGGPVGHGWAITPELQNVPLIIMDPDQQHFRINAALGSQVDLMPTILDRLRIPVPTGQLYQGGSLDSQVSDTNRTIYINSYRDYGIIHDGVFTCGNRDSQAGAATGNSQKSFTFTNDSSHTVFLPMDETNRVESTISPFDKFQQNFLHNYSDYCKMLMPTSSEEDRGNDRPVAVNKRDNTVLKP